ncbi:hypothetical protein [Amycolatopsis thermophila]|uniref:Uncharacterized protein n=1 Tax=Amycolatopsis thermophila TaxID=206084 RepID=A0ABU0F4D6_9PSEU|nr:hypothetical protein [Amycolatopsis thermophila]MDQ0382238.1 hypothetical protein [Amycolatopsis thermophila]
MNRPFWSSSLDFAVGSGGAWSEKWDRWAGHRLPYLLLGLGVVLSHRADVLAPAGAALVWLLVKDLAVPRRWRSHGITLAVSFAGTLTMAALLMYRDPLFLVFMISCFFTALKLKPAALGVLGLAATSLLINTIGSGGPVPALRSSRCCG